MIVLGFYSKRRYVKSKRSLQLREAKPRTQLYSNNTSAPTMAMPWGMTLWMAKMVWIALAGWVSSCLTVADEVAGSLRTGDIGPFHVG
ncbi:uncharacterized protein LOC107406972 isoform X2 [Ziziphus jujuba]|uniref:Uncharacterized protein LOC107406972 isoform X2 n=1 Tax=Ziziphus jujuba TaxID=326968 RepID=A0ABM3I6A3_ZIZJJ|nr:uncharacterized protein LOC107406972 isoform X2 [Ziziphus jujuba]